MFPPIVERIIAEYSWHYEKTRLDTKIDKDANIIKLGNGNVVWIEDYIDFRPHCTRVVYAMDAETGELLSDRYPCDHHSPILCDKQGRLYYIYMHQLMRADSKGGVNAIYRWRYLSDQSVSPGSYMRFDIAEEKVLVVTDNFKDVIHLQKAEDAMWTGNVYHKQRAKKLKQYVIPPLEVGRPNSDDLSVSSSPNGKWWFCRALNSWYYQLRIGSPTGRIATTVVPFYRNIQQISVFWALDSKSLVQCLSGDQGRSYLRITISNGWLDSFTM